MMDYIPWIETNKKLFKISWNTEAGGWDSSEQPLHNRRMAVVPGVYRKSIL
jgi:hypothetical protein